MKKISVIILPVIDPVVVTVLATDQADAYNRAMKQDDLGEKLMRKKFTPRSFSISYKEEKDF